MKLFIILNIFIISCWSLPTSELLNENWVEFKYIHNKNYNSLDEELERFDIFQSNLKKIEEHNKLYNDGLVTFEMGLNQFADLTADEFLNYVNKFNYQKINHATENRSVYEIDNSYPFQETIDWRIYNYVTPVKNQGQCGSCWSFSATGAIEGQLAKTRGILESLSEQNLIDCTTEYGNRACNGGFMDEAFHYVKDYGINRENEYPYEERLGYCRFNPQRSVTRVSSYIDLPQGSEQHLTHAISTVGPVSVAIDVLQDFQFYRSGIYYSNYCRAQNINHAVLAVGYGSMNNQDYYIVKNSWGSQWGEQGYVRMARNRGNNCGIASMASFPQL